MKIKIIAIGERMPDWITIGWQDYLQRFPADINMQLIAIKAEKRAKGADLNRIMEKEGEKMLAALSPQDWVIALDERGSLWSTVELSQHLQQWRDSSETVSLLIGGPEGLSAACKHRARQHWSLSKLTLPHPLVRVLMLEQLYRAWSILVNHPYHRV